MTRTWCVLGPPVSILQPLSLEKVEDLCCEAWVTWQLLPPWLGLSLVASGLVSCVSCWCEPTRGSSLLRSPPGLLSLFPPQWAESCLCLACFRTGSWGSCWKRVAWLFGWSQCNVSNAISGQYQCNVNNAICSWSQYNVSHAISGQYQSNVSNAISGHINGLTCSMARTAFVQAPQGHRSYFACQDCTCREKKKNALFDFSEHFCTHVFYLFMGMYGLSLFFLNMEPPALALAVLDLTMTGVFFLVRS